MTILSAYRENTGDGTIRGTWLEHWRKGRVEIVEGVCRTKGSFEKWAGSHCGGKTHRVSLRVRRVSGTVIPEYEAINCL